MCIRDRHCIKSKSLIQLLLANEPHKFALSRVSQIGLSDHSLIYVPSKQRSPKTLPRIINARQYKNVVLEYLLCAIWTSTLSYDRAILFLTIENFCCSVQNEKSVNFCVGLLAHMYTIAEKLQDIFTKPWKDHTPAIPLVDSDGLPSNRPRLPNIGQVKKLVKELNPRKATSADNISAWTCLLYTSPSPRDA